MKKSIKYILLFIFFFATMIYFYIPFRMDTYVNYAFTYGIVSGQIPYKDFNMIVPALSPFIYSILLIFNKSILTYYIEQSILLVLFSLCLFKLLDKKAWIIIASLFCPIIFCFTYSIFPGYNFILLFELILLILLEDKYKNKEYLIGIIASLTILTKHNIGIFIYLVAIIYPIIKNKNIKLSIKRFLYSLIPLILYLIYLLLTKSLYPFIDYCFLGMSEFKNNYQLDILYLVLTIISVIIMFIKYLKSKDKNISYYYLLAYLPVIYPLIEEYHVSLFLLFCFIVFIYNTKINLPKKIPIYSFIVILSFISIYYFLGKDYYSKLHLYHYHNFPIEFINKKTKNDYDEIIKFSKDKNVIVIDYQRVVFFSAVRDKKLTKQFIPLRGNLGLSGVKGLLNNMEKNHNTYYVIQNEYYCKNDKCQLDPKVYNTITNNYQLIKKLNYFSIYYKE